MLLVAMQAFLPGKQLNMTFPMEDPIWVDWLTSVYKNKLYYCNYSSIASSIAYGVSVIK